MADPTTEQSRGDTLVAQEQEPNAETAEALEQATAAAAAADAASIDPSLGTEPGGPEPVPSGLPEEQPPADPLAPEQADIREGAMGADEPPAEAPAAQQQAEPLGQADAAGEDVAAADTSAAPMDVQEMPPKEDPEAAIAAGGVTATEDQKEVEGAAPPVGEGAATAMETDAPLVTTAGVPIRQYLDSTVVPVLRLGLRELVKARPADPFDFLADFLRDNKPKA